MKKRLRVIGLMSGTSLDGLDIACCDFTYSVDHWKYRILKAETIPYNKTILHVLLNAGMSSGSELARLHASYGEWTGRTVRTFIQKHLLKPDLIASHGHTVFHQPEKGFTWQLGSGAEIAAACGITTVCDFRSTDVARGGQGAPLVPIGDELLFPEYDYCLNLGGFANISYREKGNRLAYDICPVNIVLNELSRRLQKPFDRGGKIAKKGEFSSALCRELGASSYYEIKGPKSLGEEWVRKTVMPVLNKSKLPVADLLHTFVIHAAEKITQSIQKSNARVLVTGGGAYNHFLMDMIGQRSKAEIFIPDDLLVQFREALIFAFLGVLRMEDQINCLSSVTGAKVDSIGGAVYSGGFLKSVRK
jgi:anhydro-N-acetylmuramic acid kinase